jgi:hypothetical protein
MQMKGISLCDAFQGDLADFSIPDFLLGEEKVMRDSDKS